MSYLVAEISYYGSLPFCLALNSADIGVTVISGKQFFTTWGRNLSREQADYFSKSTQFLPIRNGNCSEEIYELILPDFEKSPLINLLISVKN